VVHSPEEAAAKLASLDPAANAIVEGSLVPTGPATARISGYTESEYRIDYQAPGAALLRIAVPYFPGWLASVDGRALPVIPVDRALSGVVVPAGTHRLILRYESRWFQTGAIISAIFWMAIAAWIILERLAL